MSRIFYGKNPPKTFCEEMRFDSHHPYYIRIKTFPNDDIAPPHYSDDTLELMLCYRIRGRITVEDKQYELQGEESRVIVVPPGIVHSNYIKCCDGTMHVLHVSILHSSTYIGIKNLLAYQSLELSHLLLARPHYDDMISSLQQMITCDEDLILCLRELLAVFGTLCASIPAMATMATQPDAANDAKLRKLIQWTSGNYAQRVSLDDAAQEVGLSKNYFCSWFKGVTGMTYLQYLNMVRITQTCRYLNVGMSVNEAAYACGFEDISYYIQLFKKIQGCTPKAYIRNQTRTR